MPIYEYRCHNCQQTVEVLILSGETPLLCPNCGRPLLEKVMSAPHHRMGRGSERQGSTCCGRDERCDAPPCGSGGGCSRDRY